MFNIFCFIAVFFVVVLVLELEFIVTWYLLIMISEWPMLYLNLRKLQRQ